MKIILNSSGDNNNNNQSKEWLDQKFGTLNLKLLEKRMEFVITETIRIEGVMSWEKSAQLLWNFPQLLLKYGMFFVCVVSMWYLRFIVAKRKSVLFA